MKAPEPPPGYATRADIFKRVNRLRANYGLRPYASARTVHQFLRKAGCKRIFVRKCYSYYNIDDALSLASMAMEKDSPLIVRASWKNCYVTAPDHIESSPDWVTVGEAAKLIGTYYARLHMATKYNSIYTYYSERRKRKIINLEHAREWCCWRSFSFIKKRVSLERAFEIAADPNVKRKLIFHNGCRQKMYYVPELSHL